MLSLLHLLILRWKNKSSRLQAKALFSEYLICLFLFSPLIDELFHLFNVRSSLSLINIFPLHSMRKKFYSVEGGCVEKVWNGLKESKTEKNKNFKWLAAVLFRFLCVTFLWNKPQKSQHQTLSLSEYFFICAA